jgi:CRISP-associated protein Cas1
MHLLIENYGVKIEVDNEMFKLSQEDAGERHISPLKLDSINILKPCSLTTPALILAAQNQIPVLIYNNRGRVEAWVWSPSYGSIATIRKNQVYYADSADSVLWVHDLLTTKAQQQIANLDWLKRKAMAHSSYLNEQIAIIKQLVAQPPATTWDTMRGIEGGISRAYWQGIGRALSSYIVITGRVQQQVTDPLNSSINYAYGMLYGMVEASLLMAGLDPYMGFMHRIEHGKMSLVYDQIEPFRPWVDRVILDLWLTGQMDMQLYQTNTDGYVELTSVGRKLVITAILTMMDETVYLNGKRIKKSDHIHYLSRQLASTLKSYQRT